MTGRNVTITKGTFVLGTFPLVNDGPTQCNMKVYAGDTVSITFAFTDATAGTPLVLSGTWTSMIRQYPNSANPLASFTVDASGLANGTVKLSLDSATTQALTEAVWDLQETDVSGAVTTWLYGTLNVVQDVTR